MILVNNSQIKLITSLQHKKYRNKLELFVAEGPKVIKELITACRRLKKPLFIKDNIGWNKRIQQYPSRIR